VPPLKKTLLKTESRAEGTFAIGVFACVVMVDHNRQRSRLIYLQRPSPTHSDG
jgi:hypothetical protein